MRSLLVFMSVASISSFSQFVIPARFPARLFIFLFSGGSEGAGRGGDMEEVRQIWWGKVMDGFENEQKEFRVHPFGD